MSNPSKPGDETEDQDFFSVQEPPHPSVRSNTDSSADRSVAHGDVQDSPPDSGTGAEASGIPNAEDSASVDQSTIDTSRFTAVDDTAAKGSGTGSSLSSKLPPFLQLILGRYLEISLKQFSSPKRFYQELDRSEDLQEPGSFLLVSVVLNAALSAVLSMKFLLIPKLIIGNAAACVICSAMIYVMGKSMGSNASFATCFRIFAYLTCLLVISPIPGLGFITPVVGIVFTFIGLREVLKLPLSKTCMLIFLLTFLQAILAIGSMFSH